uniref:Uncharacterized protein n=1 Tax=Strigamia maritima TaxID=126957 RepID=T1JG92_STRMM
MKLGLSEIHKQPHLFLVRHLFPRPVSKSAPDAWKSLFVPVGNVQRSGETSTVLQSFILVSEPFFNEPDFESQTGTEEGKKLSEAYNQSTVLFSSCKIILTCQTQHPFDIAIYGDYIFSTDWVLHAVTDELMFRAGVAIDYF